MISLHRLIVVTALSAIALVSGVDAQASMQKSAGVAWPLCTHETVTFPSYDMAIEVFFRKGSSVSGEALPFASSIVDAQVPSAIGMNSHPIEALANRSGERERREAVGEGDTRTVLLAAGEYPRSKLKEFYLYGNVSHP